MYYKSITQCIQVYNILMVLESNYCFENFEFADQFCLLCFMTVKLSNILKYNFKNYL